MINVINRTTERYGMEINTSKTKEMRMARRQGPTIKIQIGHETVEVVSHFNYLGSIITQDGNYCKEIKSGIAQGKVNFERQRRTLTGKLKMELKKRFIKSFIWSVALYGSETWTKKATDKKHSGSIWNVDMEEDAEDKLERPQDRRRSTKNSWRRENSNHNN